ncbi:MAG TPA: LuxR C-terminal-related transcriptional regulator [Ktedonobacteraceae bacterium]|nr:LuxR C-terminal-related transcriptional regulator [Ktedonobacteraceae bacterium]
MSDATVKTHINHIFSKLGARDRSQVVIKARQFGLA